MDSSEMPTEKDDWKNVPSKKERGKLKLEYRVKKEHWSKRLFKGWREWKAYHKRYRTSEQRQEAMDVMNRKDGLFEYRIPPTQPTKE